MDKMEQDFLQDDLRVFVVPVDIFDVKGLTCHEQMVYIVLRSHCSAREKTAWPSYATIAKEGRMSRDKAIQAVKKLIELGLISKNEEPRYVVNKNKKIVQTSNLYKIHTPSRLQRLPRSFRTTTPVVQDDHPSRSGRPKQDHLTDPSEQDSFNNNKDVVVAIESSLGTPVKNLLPQLKQWVEEYGAEYLLDKAQYIGSLRPKIKNVIGAFRAAVTENYQTTLNEVAVTSEGSHDKSHDRYEAFYSLFPDA